MLAEHDSLGLRHLHACQQHRTSAGEGRWRHLVLPDCRLRVRRGAGARHHRGRGQIGWQGYWRRQASLELIGLLVLPAAGAGVESQDYRHGQCRWRHHQHHQTGVGIWHRRGRPETRWPSAVHYRCSRARFESGTRPEFHRNLLLGLERRNPRVFQAVLRARQEQGAAFDGAGRGLFGPRPLLQGARSDGRQSARWHQGGRQDEVDADRRSAVRPGHDPRGWPQDPSGLSVRGQEAGGIQGTVGLLQADRHDPGRPGVQAIVRERLPFGKEVATVTRRRTLAGVITGLSAKDRSMQALYAQLLVGLINGSFYALLSLGLAVIFGMLNIINFAHGALYMMGAFCAYFLLNVAGIGYWPALIIAPIAVGIFGMILERTMLQWLSGLDHLYGLLLTFGLALIIQGLFRNEFGSSGLPYAMPAQLAGGRSLGFMFLPIYRGWVVVFSLVVCLLTWYLIEKTRLGAYLRAATENPTLVRAFGVNVPRMITLTYGLGVGLAALAGVLSAPINQVRPLMGENMIIVVFAVVVIGGMGSIMGSIITGFALGVIEGLTKYFYPEASNTVVFVLMVLVLLVKPTGLTGRAA